jgi:hypothetical protein
MMTSLQQRAKGVSYRRAPRPGYQILQRPMMFAGKWDF